MAGLFAPVPERIDIEACAAALFHPTRPELLVAAAGDLGVWDPSRRSWARAFAALDTPGEGASGTRFPTVAFGPGGRSVAAHAIHAPGEALAVWSYDDGARTQVTAIKPNTVGDVVVMDNRGTLVTGNWKGQVERWSADGQRAELYTHEHEVSAVMRLGAESVASASLDTTVRVWNLGAAAVERTFDDFRDHVYALAATPAGDHLAAGGAEGTTFVWSLREARTPAVLEADEDLNDPSVDAICFLDDQGTHLAALHRDGGAFVWRVADATVVQRLDPGENTDGDDAPIYDALTVSHDGSTLALVGERGLWTWRR